MNAISFMTANYVARETGWAMHGWGHGDRATNDRFRPLETFGERFDELLRDVRALGFDTIDVWGAHLNAEWATDEHVATARELLARHELRVASYALWLGPSIAERACDIALALGTDLIGAGASGDLASLGRILEARGVRLGFENHPERTPRELLEKIEEGGSAFGVTIDTGWWATHEYDAARAIEELADRLLHVHLKDVQAPGEPHETCRWGDGIVPIEECVRTLQRIAYRGTITIEHEPEHEDPSSDIAEMRTRLQGWLA